MYNTICNKKVTGGIYNISEHPIALNNTNYISIKIFIFCLYCVKIQLSTCTVMIKREIMQTCI